MALRKKFQAPSINLQASVNDSIDSLNFDITNNGTIRLLRQSCGEVLVNQEGIKFCGNGKRSDTDTHYKVSSRDICEFQVVGSGASSHVKKAIDLRENRFVAVKVINVMDKDKRHQLLTEIRTLCEAETQDSVVKFYGAFYTPEKSQISIVLEYMDAGSLADIIEKTGGVREDVLGKVAEQVLDALSYMHTSQHAMHRDIKPGNILLNYQGETKVSDFGISAMLEDTRALCLTFVGTTCYMSPERLNNDPYTSQADIWSLGLSLVEAATGKYPYNTDHGPVSLCLEISEGAAPVLPADQFSANLIDFVARCLEKDPSKRWTCAQLLQHPFMQASRAQSVDVAGYLQQSLDLEERLQSYAQLFAAHFYTLLDNSLEGLHHFTHLYKDHSLLSLDGERCEGPLAIIARLEAHSKQRAGGDSTLHTHHTIEKVDVQPCMGGLLTHVVGRLQLKHNQQVTADKAMFSMSASSFCLPSPEK
eukprot:CAMPEP_0198231590 /NCGR_PEP_ID=MMETSP1445-20131203/115283_1 /TAXON_ID=36898 /ORGANISM="Pyramimonas sp., Strain CCMP2087" /LENGTH=475 /DNA_ID=CAMNT_0043912215 /DNA_START=434 /DNA_END=1862 /DNA_ORIENTATION=-